MNIFLEVRENRIKEKEGSLMINEESETTYNANQSGNDIAKNTILYGPPGTGKHTIPLTIQLQSVRMFPLMRWKNNLTKKC